MTRFFFAFELSRSVCRPGHEDHRKKTLQNSIAEWKSHTWALDVTDDAAGSVIHELDTDLGDTTTGAGTAENTSHLDELNRLLGGIHLGGWARRQREG